MPRVNVWLPEALAETLRTQLPHVNVSQLLQGAIRSVLGCHHERLACASCSAPVDKWALVDERMDGFYGDVLFALHPVVTRGGTAEGAARVLKEVALRWQIPGAKRTPLPRANRAERDAVRVRDFPTESASRKRHPTARATARKGELTEESA